MSPLGGGDGRDLAGGGQAARHVAQHLAAGPVQGAVGQGGLDRGEPGHLGPATGAACRRRRSAGWRTARRAPPASPSAGRPGSAGAGRRAACRRRGPRRTRRVRPGDRSSGARSNRSSRIGSSATRSPSTSMPRSRSNQSMPESLTSTFQASSACDHLIGIVLAEGDAPAVARELGQVLVIELDPAHRDVVVLVLLEGEVLAAVLGREPAEPGRAQGLQAQRRSGARSSAPRTACRAAGPAAGCP